MCETKEITKGTSLYQGTYRYDFYEFNMHHENLLWFSLKNNVSHFALPSMIYGQQRVLFDIRNSASAVQWQIINNAIMKGESEAIEHIFNQQQPQQPTKETYIEMLRYLYTPRIITYTVHSPMKLLDIGKGTSANYSKNKEVLVDEMKEKIPNLKEKRTNKSSIFDRFPREQHSAIIGFFQEKGYDGLFENFNDNNFLVLWNFNRIEVKSIEMLDKFNKIAMDEIENIAGFYYSRNILKC